MLVKTFSGTTIAEALASVRDALGEDACILETRRNARGVEVFACAERSGSRTTAHRSTSLPMTESARRFEEDLVARGFSITLAARIARAAQANLDPDQLADRATAFEYARGLLSLWLRTGGPSGESVGRRW